MGKYSENGKELLQAGPGRINQCRPDSLALKKRRHNRLDSGQCGEKTMRDFATGVTDVISSGTGILDGNQDMAESLAQLLRSVSRLAMAHLSRLQLRSRTYSPAGSALDIVQEVLF